MQPGTELNALVAEKVMEWKREGDWFEVPYWISGGTFQAHADAFRFSTEIASAWQVVEKMREFGWFFYMDNGSQGDSFFVTFHEGKDFSDDGCSASAEAPTAPLAICLAALKALGVEVPA